MILSAKIDTIVKSDFTLAVGAAMPSQQVRVNIDPAWPLDMLLVIVSGQVNATAPVAIAADGLLNILKRANLTINDGVARTVVDASGAGILDYAFNVFPSLDRDTLAQYLHVPIANGVPNINMTGGQTFQITYPIFLAHPQLVDPLRMFTLLPTHVHKQDPVLTLDFSSLTELNLAGTLQSLSFNLVKIARDMPLSVHNEILSRGGYLGYDFLETETAVAASNADLRIDMPSPGKYSGLLVRHYSNQYLRGDITDGNNPYWRVEAGGSVYRRWKNSHLLALNDLSRAGAPNVSSYPLVNSTGQTVQTTLQDFASGGAWAAPIEVKVEQNDATIAAALNKVPCPFPLSSFYLDFLTDNCGTDANELGSLMDTEKFGPQVKTQLIGAATGGTYNKIKTLAHRFYGDVNRFKITAK